MKWQTLSLAVLLLWTSACNPGSTTANETIVGAWQIMVPLGILPPQLHIIEFWEDGTYIYSAGTHGERGGYSAVKGVLTFRNNSQKYWWGDKITYQLPDPDHLVITQTKAVPPLPGRPPHITLSGTLTRIKHDSFIATKPLGGQNIPSNLPGMGKFAFLLAQRWRDDAIPVVIDARLKGHGEFFLVFTFYSPKTRAGLQIPMERYWIGWREVANARWGTKAIPLDFVDLPAAVQTARAEGVTNPILSMELRVWDPGPLWTLHAGKQAIPLHAISGKRHFGTRDASIEDYNKQWNQAVANLKKRFQKEQYDRWDCRPFLAFQNENHPGYQQDCALLKQTQIMCENPWHDKNEAERNLCKD
ncbi:MAG: hypothetical protein AB7T38_11910 [Nitrospirales bacterium]